MNCIQCNRTYHCKLFGTPLGFLKIWCKASNVRVHNELNKHFLTPWPNRIKELKLAKVGEYFLLCDIYFWPWWPHIYFWDPQTPIGAQISQNWEKVIFDLVTSGIELTLNWWIGSLLISPTLKIKRNVNQPKLWTGHFLSLRPQILTLWPDSL